MNSTESINKKVVIVVLGSLNGLMPFSTDLYLPAFPSIASQLHTDIGQVTFTMSSFFAGSCIGQLFNGPILDRFGRKVPMMFGLLLFSLTSLGCAWTSQIVWLIALRFVQALGISICAVGSRAVVRDIFPTDQTASIFSLLALIMGIAPIVAPSVGSLILTMASWRAIFYLLAGLSFTLMLVLYFFLPHSVQADTSYSLHPKAIIQQYKTVLQTPGFLPYAFVAALASSTLFAWISSSSLIFIENFQLSPQQFGWVFASTASCLVLSNQLNRMLLKKYPSKTIAFRAATVQLLVTNVLLLIVVYWFQMPVVLAGLYAFMLSLHLITPNAMALTLKPFQKNIGSATALMGALQMTCSATTTAVLSLLYNRTPVPMVLIMILLALISTTIQYYTTKHEAIV